jgi:hypothetical protein
MSTLQRATTSDEGRIKQAAFNCAFIHLPTLAEGDSTSENNTNVYCFVHRESDQLCLMYSARIGDYLFPLSTYKKELSYLATLPQHLMEATVCAAIEAIVIHGEEQLAKQFAL